MPNKSNPYIWGIKKHHIREWLREELKNPPGVKGISRLPSEDEVNKCIDFVRVRLQKELDEIVDKHSLDAIQYYLTMKKKDKERYVLIAQPKRDDGDFEIKIRGITAKEWDSGDVAGLLIPRDKYSDFVDEVDSYTDDEDAEEEDEDEEDPPSLSEIWMMNMKELISIQKLYLGEDALKLNEKVNIKFARKEVAKRLIDSGVLVC